MTTTDIQPVPAPWKLKGVVYLFPFWTNKSDIAKANEAGITYSPLEANSAYASAESGQHIGGMSMIQIIRYRESPVGPYDELILAPGFHEYVVEEEDEEEDDGKRVKKKNARITRIYVSQKYTCWNGRNNWNIPKHLASFDFKEDQDGTTHVQVFPHDTTGDPSEAAPSRKPFFRARFKPIPYVPSFPVSTRLAKYVGYDLSFAQPPVPEGNTSQGELSGTDKWCALTADESSRKASLGWFDLRQADEQGNTTSEFENFWPGLKRWKLGLKMEDTDFDISEGRYWEPPKSTL